MLYWYKSTNSDAAGEQAQIEEQLTAEREKAERERERQGGRETSQPSSAPRPTVDAHVRHATSPSKAANALRARYSPQFTCFTSTKVQILTHAIRASGERAPPAVGRTLSGLGSSARAGGVDGRGLHQKDYEENIWPTLVRDSRYNIYIRVYVSMYLCMYVYICIYIYL